MRFQQAVARRSGQVERSRQGSHGLDMRAPSFPPLERAHGMDREAGNRRELFLREARRFPEPLQLRPK